MKPISYVVLSVIVVCGVWLVSMGALTGCGKRSAISPFPIG